MTRPAIQPIVHDGRVLYCALVAGEYREGTREHVLALCKRWEPQRLTFVGITREQGMGAVVWYDVDGTYYGTTDDRRLVRYEEVATVGCAPSRVVVYAANAWRILAAIERWNSEDTSPIFDRRNR